MTLKTLALAAATLGYALMAVEPAAALKNDYVVTESQKAECLKQANKYAEQTGHHGLYVRSDCLERAKNSNAAAARKQAEARNARLQAEARDVRMQAEARNARIKSEMDKEAQSYNKMKEERQRNKTTTENCYMKNGNLDCNPQ